MINSQYLIVLISVLIVFSYLFDLFARKTKFPSVILLMLTGILCRAAADYWGYEIKYLNQIIPFMGTVGLVLIVLEGALELEVNKEKLSLILKSFLSAFMLLILTTVVLTVIFMNYMDMGWEASVLNAIPLSVISSSVAIPSATALGKNDQDFVTYESTFSDILGIMFFNYCLEQFTHHQPLVSIGSLGFLFVKIIGIILFSGVLVWVLFQLMGRLNHKVKFFLIISILMIFYAVGKYYHLPLLVTIFIFGVFLGNSKTLFPKFILINRHFLKAGNSLNEFHLITAESTFLVRTFFFLLFGFSITFGNYYDVEDFMNGGIIVGAILLIRAIYMLLIERHHSKALIFFSPRGLITILLFWQLQSVPEFQFQSKAINEKVLLVVILGSMLAMMIGTIGFPVKKEEKSEKINTDEIE